MKYLVQKERVLWLVTIALVLLAGCSQAPEATPQPTQTPLPPPLDITYCDIDPADICLEGFGLDIQERLLVLFRVVEDPLYTGLYIRTDGPDGEVLFECQQSQNFPENIYCLGEPFPEGEFIKLNIYSQASNKLLAIGVFNVQYGDLPEADVVFEADITPVPSPRPTLTPSPQPSYPNPSYPNPSYPNPTSSP